MIKAVTDKSELAFLKCTDIYSGKILSLLSAYSVDYDFCRFYCQAENVMARLGNEYILSASDSDTDYKELAFFLTMNGFSSVLTDEKTGKALEKELDAEYTYNYLVEFRGEQEECERNAAPKLTEVFDILKTGFDIDYESWYLDMSHSVRHGVTKVFMLDGASTCTMQFNIYKTAFISQVATLPEMRGKRLAERLLRSVCGELRENGSRVYLACREALLPFYKKVEFEQTGRVCVITSKDKGK